MQYPFWFITRKINVVASWGPLGHVPLPLQFNFSVHFRADSDFVRWPLQKNICSLYYFTSDAVNATAKKCEERPICDTTRDRKYKRCIFEAHFIATTR